MNVRVFLDHFGYRLPVGILVQHGHEILFQYDPYFLEKGIALSPYLLPLRREIFCDRKNTFDGLFGVFHDSLPDGWGLLLLDRALSRIGSSLAQTTPLERLTLAGRNAMGSLEYEPDNSTTTERASLDPDTLARESERLLGEHSYYKGGYIDTLMNYLALTCEVSRGRTPVFSNIPRSKHWCRSRTTAGVSTTPPSSSSSCLNHSSPNSFLPILMAPLTSALINLPSLVW